MPGAKAEKRGDGGEGGGGVGRGGRNLLATLDWTVGGILSRRVPLCWFLLWLLSLQFRDYGL